MPNRTPRHRFCVASAAGLALVLACAGARAQPQPAFTYNVPVRLAQIHHDVETIKVTCSTRGDGVPTKLSNHFIEPGRGDHEVDLVIEQFANANEVDLTRYTSWRCNVTFKKSGTAIYKEPSADAEEAWLRVRPGAFLDTGLQSFPQ